MAKQKTYTIPVTLRMTPTMLEYVQEQAAEKGITIVDWIRSRNRLCVLGRGLCEK